MLSPSHISLWITAFYHTNWGHRVPHSENKSYISLVTHWHRFTSLWRPKCSFTCRTLGRRIHSKTPTGILLHTWLPQVQTRPDLQTSSHIFGRESHIISHNKQCLKEMWYFLSRVKHNVLFVHSCKTAASYQDLSEIAADLAKETSFPTMFLSDPSREVGWLSAGCNISHLSHISQ